MTRKKIFLLCYIILLTFIFYIDFSNICYGVGYPTLINTIMKAFEKIKTWLIRLATPAAAVAVGTGLFMRKFSFGDEEKIRTGKNLVKGSLFSYAFILVIDLILSTIQGLIG